MNEGGDGLEKEKIECEKIHQFGANQIVFATNQEGLVTSKHIRFVLCFM